MCLFNSFSTLVQALRICTGRMAHRGSRGDRKSVGQGKSVDLRVDLGGRRIIKKKNSNENHHH
jgi:hypothetical protein